MGCETMNLKPFLFFILGMITTEVFLSPWQYINPNVPIEATMVMYLLIGIVLAFGMFMVALINFE
jgi:hypothetical protein